MQRAGRNVWETVQHYVFIRNAIMKVDAVEDLVPRGAAFGFAWEAGFCV